MDCFDEGFHLLPVGVVLIKDARYMCRGSGLDPKS